MRPKRTVSVAIVLRDGPGGDHGDDKFFLDECGRNEPMTGEGTAGETRVELYARDELPSVAEKRHEQVVGRLRDLAAAGHVDAVTTHSWPKTVPDRRAERESDRYERFVTWADERAVSLAPFFETRQRYTSETGETGTRLVLPALCLAVYREGDLGCVYPHSTNDGSRSVMDGLRAIESAHRSSLADRDSARTGSD